MSVFAVRIVKKDRYGGGEKEFGNTYHFETNTLEAFDDASVALMLAAEEKKIVQQTVDFVRWESWGPTDGAKFDNVMREKQPLSGTGAGLTITGMYREAAVVVVWPLPRSPITNRRRWLRKFIRCPAPVGASFTDGMISGADAMTTTVKQAFLDYANAVVGSGFLNMGAELCTEDGVQSNAPPIVRDFIVTRDIGR